MIKAVMFDLDNTIIDFIKMKKHSYYEAAKAMVRAGYSKSEDQIRDELFKSYLYNGVDSSKVFSAILDENIESALKDKIIALATNAYIKAKLEHLHPYQDTVFVLSELRKMGLKLAIITDSQRIKAYRRLDAMGIIDLFDCIVTLTDTNKTKPHELPFRTALKMLGCEPGEVVHVGDWPERDIHGAQAVGIKTIWAKYGLHGNESADRWKGGDAGADHNAESFMDILNIVKKMQLEQI